MVHEYLSLGCLRNNQQNVVLYKIHKIIQLYFCLIFSLTNWFFQGTMQNLELFMWEKNHSQDRVRKEKWFVFLINWLTSWENWLSVYQGLEEIFLTDVSARSYDHMRCRGSYIGKMTGDLEVRRSLVPWANHPQFITIIIWDSSVWKFPLTELYSLLLQAFSQRTVSVQ